MSPFQGGGNDRVRSRRSVLKQLGTAGVVAGTAGCISDSGGGQETTVGSDTVTFGLTTSESGSYNSEGNEEQRGFNLAVEHLNNGGGLVETNALGELSGNGVLGNEVETVVYDTGGNVQQFDEIEQSFERNDEIVMYTGGLDGDVVLALRDAAEEHGIPYMAGPMPIDSLTGTNCSEYVFRELFPSTAIARALVPTLVDMHGQNVTYFQISVDDPAGANLENAIGDQLSNETEWQSNGNESTVSGSRDFEDEMRIAEGSVSDVVFLNLFGLDAVNALNQASELLSSSVQVVAPFLNRPIAETVSDDIANVLGTVPWISSLNNDQTSAFVDAYQAEFGSGGDSDEFPSGIAHHSYVQTLQYAAAAERAESFDPDDVVAELNDHSYDAGLGDQTMRACDHQATRPVPVVTGRVPSEQSNGRYLSRLSLAENVVPACEEAPAMDCSF